MKFLFHVEMNISFLFIFVATIGYLQILKSNATRTMKKKVFSCLICGMAFLTVQAQQEAFDEFRRAAGDNASLYSGELEERYHQQKYINHPYWETDEFREGTVCFDGRIYPNQKLRFDTYRKALLIIIPEKRNILQVNKEKLDYFIINGVKYIPYKDTYAALLYESSNMKMVGYIKCLFSRPVAKEGKMYQHFAKEEQFALTLDGKEHTLDSRSDLLNLFPTYKRALKSYAKTNGLKFSAQPMETMKQLAMQADLMMKGGKQ